MPTAFPKCSPTEMLGLLVLLEGHREDEEIALLADDLDLEIDEILPSVDFAEILGFLKVSDGRATLTDLGKTLLKGSISSRKSIIRDRLLGATLFKTLARALESSPEHRLTEEQLLQLVSLTPAAADELVQNIINWGRYAELFRFDSDEHLLLPPRPRGARTASSRRPPNAGSGRSEDRTSSTEEPRATGSSPIPSKLASSLATTLPRREPSKGANP